jgi:hypothetical protein
MNVKIIATGEPCGTRVLTEDGTDITDNVTAVVWRHEGGGSIPTAEVTIGLIEIEAAGVARMVAPNGKAIARIEYADGSADDYPTDLPQGAVHKVTAMDGRVRHIR